jgi:predicted nucleic acid-binding protein
MARIALDTDVVSHHRVGRLPAEYTRLVATAPHCIAFATAAELWKGALDKRWGGARRAGLDLWLATEPVLPASLRVAKVWGAITAGAQARGRPRPLNDTWIAACCMQAGLPLLTLKSLLRKPKSHRAARRWLG